MSAKRPRNCRLTAILNVVLDDRMGKRARHDDAWRWIPTSVPNHAAGPLRDFIQDKSTWEGLEFWNGVPLHEQPTMWQWLLGKKQRTATATFESATLLDKNKKEFEGSSSVEVCWNVTGARPMDIDFQAAQKYLDEQQLRGSGWSEGIMQLRFGPPVVCNEDGSRCRLALSQEILRDGLTSHDDGRYAMTLTFQGRGTHLYGL